MAIARIVSDGGGDGIHGAGAAVVYLPVGNAAAVPPTSTSPVDQPSDPLPSEETASESSTDGRYKIVALLGGVDSTEAELSAGILGMLFISCWIHSRNESAPEVEWASDNEHVIQFGRTLPALDPKRREPLWQLAARLTAEWQIRTIHVSSFPGAHSVKRAHHSCDRASTWIQRSGEKLLSESGLGPIGLHRDQSPESCWQLCDMRPLLASLSSADSKLIELRIQEITEQLTRVVP